MAGHRTRDRDPDGTVHPRRAALSATNRHQRSLREYSVARTEQERCGEMYRVLCSSAAALRKRDPETADRLVREVISAMQSAAEQMLTQLDSSTSPQRRRRGSGPADQTAPEPAPVHQPAAADADHRRGPADELVVRFGGPGHQETVVISTPPQRRRRQR